MRLDSSGAATSGVVGIDRQDRKISGIDSERCVPERKSEACLGCTRNRALLCVARTAEALHQFLCVRGRRKDEGGTGIEDGGASSETGIGSIGRDGVHCTLPESLRVDVGDSNKGVCDKLGGVKSTKGDLSIIELISKTRDLEGGDRRLDELVYCQRFDWSKNFLL